jgi:predicted membrane channel-forming protein YqfA (hemolysin III family)
VSGTGSRPARQPRRPKTPEEEDAQFNGILALIAGGCTAYLLFSSSWEAPWWVKGAVVVAVIGAIVALLDRFKRTARTLRYVVYSIGAVLFLLLIIRVFQR